ncbi:cupin (plasmid) [Legionella adelaidensis]|uniref:Cupin n=1 Tax=Legionella adelaidensis TaxID=45056 RepID=A0A0W0R1V6_9GAMM|nr:cupin domain-containing protein [Legionella adelaidensis]KTC65075.1 cupin [Legionella adelaidensis]VEH85405.1 cupin [Legionella adelaidensis]
MIQFKTISVDTFLAEYWQKKPLVIKNAMPDFVNSLSPEELAGLSLDENIESRLVIETPGEKPFWHLKKGPFSDKDFSSLPKSHWTLLVNGVDRLIPDVFLLRQNFQFIPQWRFDDVMISFAVEGGSVGPHYDNYDVFLYQAIGRRHWKLTTQNCIPENHLAEVPLRIMKEFMVEEEYILEEGDMLYLPPHVGHYGVSLSERCMTYSFGYRSYGLQEMWESFAVFLEKTSLRGQLYKDPCWKNIASGEIVPYAWQLAKSLMQKALEDEQTVKNWFGSYVTSLDEQAEYQLPEPDGSIKNLTAFSKKIKNCEYIILDGACRLAYIEDPFTLFVNGTQWNIEGVSKNLIKHFVNNLTFPIAKCKHDLEKEENLLFLYEFAQLGWIRFEK